MNTAAQPATSTASPEYSGVDSELHACKAMSHTTAQRAPGPDCCYFCWAGERDREVRELRAAQQEGQQ